MISKGSMNPLISIIIPAYNEAGNITTCLKSIANQNYKKIEVVLVDDASKDETVSISDDFSKKEKINLKIITQKAHRERGFTRNLGAKESSGDYLLFIDADMKLYKKVVSECVEKMKNSDDRAIIIPEESIGVGFWAQTRALERRCYIGDNNIEAARFFEKKAFWNVGGWDLEMISGEDWDLTKRMGKKYSVGRIQSFIQHNEGNLSLWKAGKKKFYYALKSKTYLKKYPLSFKDVIFFIFRPAFVRNWKLILSDPIHGIGIILLKSMEFFAGGVGLLLSKFSHPLSVFL